MNGRLYDPVLHRFLQPDNFVQDPFNTQNFNRYSYVLNNPLLYTDPSGEFWHLVIGAVVGGVINLISNANKIENFWQGLGYFSSGALVGLGTAALGGWITGITESAGIITGGLIGAGAGSVTGALSNVALNGLNNVIGGQNFWQGWKQSVISGAISGAISGGISGGIQGYRLAKSAGKNIWWGNDIKYGRNQWSFFTSEKPYETINWNINDNIGSKSINDCVPTSFAEMEDYFGGTKSYEQYKQITNYTEGVGVFSNTKNYNQLLSNNFKKTAFSKEGLLNLSMMKQVQNRGAMIHVRMPHSGIMHADNLRSISYYHSGKIMMKFRIGNYNLSSVDSKWSFFLIKGK